MIEEAVNPRTTVSTVLLSKFVSSIVIDELCEIVTM
jgi:hypothetical protein